MPEEIEEREEKPEKKKFLKIAIISGVGVAIIITIVILYLFLLPKFSKESTDAKSAQIETNKPVLYTLDDFIVNLFHPSEDRFLRVKIELELQNQGVKKEIEKKLPQIRDSLLMLLSSKNVEELSTLQGKITLKNEILNRINSILTTGRVSAVYFTDFIIQ